MIYNPPLPYSTEVCTDRRQKAVSRKQKAEDRAAKLEAGQVSSFEFRVSTDRSVQKADGKGQNAERSPTAWISRYAWGQDYHNVMRAKLEKLRAAVENLAPGVETRVYVDTGPIVERAFARYSGIGWVGKNTCLINEAKGSWFFIGVMLTNLELDPDLPATDRCGSCTRCLEACPTGALVEPYVMDASRCVAYFTIELKGSIPAELRPAIGANVFGCDICQDVCPWNSKDRGQGSGVTGQKTTVEATADPQVRKVAITSVAEFYPMMVDLARSEPMGTRSGAGDTHRSSAGQERPEPLTPDPRPLTFSLFNPPLEALASLTEEDFRKVFSHSPVKRVKYRGWLRNLCMAMGNSGDPRFLPWLEKAREHDDPSVREHAAWALERIRP